MPRSTTSKRKRRGRKSGVKDEEKLCSKCKRSLNLECFTWSKTRNAWSSWCKSCQNGYQNAKRSEH